jgi:hypothetical protein
MPNHCYNILKLKDNPKKTKQTLKPFITKNEGEEFFDFDKVIPMPTELQIESMNADPSTKEGRELKKKQDKNLEKYGSKDWYDWCVSNWGTKWNSYDSSVQEDCVSFNTAWAPPIPVIIELAEKTGKTWTLLYSEPGMDFCGELTADKTGWYDDKQYTHKKAPKKFKDDMGISDDMFMSEEEIEAKEKKKATKRVKKEVAKKGKNQLIELQ